MSEEASSIQDLLTMGRQHVADGDVVQARHCFQQAVDVCKNDAPGSLLLAQLYHNIGLVYKFKPN